MSSWRDETPEHVQADLDTLTDELLKAAVEFVEKRGEFAPFAMKLADEGITLMAAAPGEDALELLYAGAAADRDAVRAVGFADLVETEDGEAVRAQLEHRDGGPAIALLLPFARKRLRRGYEFGELDRSRGERHVWATLDSRP